MEKLRLITIQSFMISFFMLVLIGVEFLVDHLQGEDSFLPWYIPLSIIIVSILTAVPTLIFYKDGEWIRTTPRLIIHGISCYLIVMLAGFIFKWYTSFKYFLITSIIFIVIYVLVWVSSAILVKAEVKKINAVLENFRDEE